MKSILFYTLMFISAMGSASANNIPAELLDLLPEGESQVRLHGRTADSKSCVTEINGDQFSFSATIMVFEADGTFVSERMPKFQIGFGHNLVDFEQVDDTLIASSFHKAEESYSRNSRATMAVQRHDGSINSVEILDEEEHLFRWKKRAAEICTIGQ